MRDAGGDVLALAPFNALGFPCHLLCTLFKTGWTGWTSRLRIAPSGGEGS
jgi:hypothetical protein